MSPKAFREFSLPYLQQIAVGIKQELALTQTGMVPLVVYAKGAHYAIEDLVCSNYDVIGLDWTMDPVETKMRVKKILQSGKTGKKRITLQGNLDPGMLYATPERLRSETETMLVQKCFEQRATLFRIKAFLLDEQGNLEKDIGYICNLGHGIQPEVDPDNVKVFLETVDQVSRRILKQNA